ncbi:MULTISPECIES: Bug family tripartite tricarboxylate transporter substrate binding protein [Hydrogenophaga]|uniref:Putative Bug-like extra-cytoplasmic solute receptor, TTT family n=1 Tax=Hydrogenophaga intermedia TaxID=65786 RepID=A0A1L1PGB7_HYDIT|nr:MULTISPECIES: tripartite tricarboxylate transporter substrate binding protein [Hydrogenophaga]AOS81223.1 MFS transporter [Hydrogenophaga sp. PBC]TMU74005.1 tripartite tricarboxylate transporter substrate binding protein [Hydrogenophaga intermedia]CDN86829.1 Putative Bug-like extra-cytoplasmic solute receptor, TTT family [Hydrogenophaga intermedia]
MNRITLTRRSLVSALTVATTVGMAALAPMTASAQDAYPSKMVRIVVPFPPGGSTDLLARKIGEKLSAQWKQPVIVDNRPGAGGTVGADHVSKAAPDGYTLLIGVTGSNGIAGSLYPNLPYDPIKGFTPVTAVVSAPLIIVRNERLSAKTLPELVAAAKAKPGSITYGSPGTGTSMHLTGEMFELATKTALLHIPYRGSAGALTDLMGGQIDLMFGDVLVVMPQIEAKKITPIAVTSKERHPLFPNVPTVAESGYPGFEALSWQGLFAPPGTPAAVVDKINKDVNAALASPDIQEYFVSRGFKLGGSGAAEYKAFIEAENKKWAGIVKTAGVKPD